MNMRATLAASLLLVAVLLSGCNNDNEPSIHLNDSNPAVTPPMDNLEPVPSNVPDADSPVDEFEEAPVDDVEETPFLDVPVE